MRTDRVKQIAVITERDASRFEERMNEVLSGLNNPDIKLYDGNPFTAVITYTVCRDVPESIIELFEMVEGVQYRCEDCPELVKSEDKRKRSGTCTRKCELRRYDSSVCEAFYLIRYQALISLRDKYLDMPFTPE